MALLGTDIIDAVERLVRKACVVNTGSPLRR
jgi:hypothetical protein